MVALLTGRTLSQGVLLLLTSVGGDLGSLMRAFNMYYIISADSSDGLLTSIMITDTELL